MGSYRFYEDYYSNGMWKAVRSGYEVPYSQIPPLPSRIIGENIMAETIKASSTSPFSEVDHKHVFYDELCRHCLLPLSYSGTPDDLWNERTCKCWLPSESSKRADAKTLGLGHCGCVIPIKFTVLEAFNPISTNDRDIPLLLVLASETDVVSAGTATGELQTHVAPLNAMQIQQSLGIINPGVPSPTPICACVLPV
ncbi:hypothetical protein TWF173_005236 [Orbilia oligospora]|nr:hypothetical protein TWF173_005236 [Orbilia oligospora]